MQLPKRRTAVVGRLMQRSAGAVVVPSSGVRGDIALLLNSAVAGVDGLVTLKCEASKLRVC